MSDDSYEFCEGKIQILKEYVLKGEELLSSLQAWESLAGILAQRDTLIKRLQDLETLCETKNSQQPSTQEQKDKINGLIKLILDMDQDSIKLIQEEQKKTLENLKNNQKQQKIINYEINMIPSQGIHLDSKK